TLNEVKKRNGLILIEETELNFKGKNYKKEQQTKNENLKLPYLTAKILDKEFQKTVLQKLEGPTRLIAGGALVQKIPIKNFDWRYDIKDYAETHEGIGKNCQVITKLFEKTKQKAFSYKDGKIASLFYANVIKSTEEDVFFMFIQNIVKKYKGIKNVDLSIDTYKSIGQKVENYFNENNFIINLYTEITTSIPADWINVNLLHKIIKYKKLYKDIFICAGSDHIKKIRPTLIDLGFKSIKKCSNKISQFEINTTKKISYSNPILVTKAYFPVYDLKKEFFDAIPPRKTNLSIKYIQKTKDSFIGNKRKRDDDDETLPPNKRQKFLN
ncbi:hypothetical protein KAH94_00940, partial [bacterium]|nr:hypothetical protein [bacterium]